MAEFNTLPIFTDALLADTTHLNDAEFGSYIGLLVVAWRRPSCTLPDDDTFLARVARCSLRLWRSSRRAVMAPFFAVEGGEWRQKKLLEVRARVAEKVAKRKAAAEARWAKNKDLADAPAVHVHGRADATKTKSVSDDTDTIPPVSPPLPDPVAEEPRKVSRASRETHGMRLPADWQPAPGGLAYAREVGMATADTLEEEIERFREHWLQKSGREGRKADWDLAWRSWCRNWRDWGRHKGRLGHPRGQSHPLAGHASRFERADLIVEEFINDAANLRSPDDRWPADGAGAPAGHLRLACAAAGVR